MKEALLEIVDQAAAGGWSISRVCGLLELDRGRLWRWKQRTHTTGLNDRKRGGHAVNTILAWEEEAILLLFDEWGPTDRSHRKLAHRGSYLDRVYVSPSTVDRVLARNGLVLAGNPRPTRTVKKPWPDWVEWRPNQLWC